MFTIMIVMPREFDPDETVAMITIGTPQLLTEDVGLTDHGFRKLMQTLKGRGIELVEMYLTFMRDGQPVVEEGWRLSPPQRPSTQVSRQIEVSESRKAYRTYRTGSDLVHITL